MIFELAKDFTDALAFIPAEHPKRRIVALFEEAIRRDINFLDCHPTTLFQCMWNNCWWYDCPEAAAHYIEPEKGWTIQSAPWMRPNTSKLYPLMERWHNDRKQLVTPYWLRAKRPLPMRLGTAQKLVLRGHSGYVDSASYSPDGQRIVSGSADSTVRIWDAENGKELVVMRGHEGAVNSVSYSPDGQKIASGSSDRTIRIWDAESGKELVVMRGHEGHVNSVSYRPDGQRVVSGSSDHTLRIWDALNGTELSVLRRENRLSFNSVSYSPDGQQIVSGSPSISYSWVKGSTLCLWDAESGTELDVFRGKDEINCVSYSPDGRRFASGSSDNMVRVWDVESGEELAVMYSELETGENMYGKVYSLSYSPNGQRIVSGGIHGVRIWDADSGIELAVFRGGLASNVLYSPDGKRIAICEENKIIVLDPAIDIERSVLREPEFIIDADGLAYSQSGQKLVSRDSGQGFKVWDTESGVELASLDTGTLDIQWLRNIGYQDILIGQINVRVLCLSKDLVTMKVIEEVGDVDSINVGVKTSSTPLWHTIVEGGGQLNIKSTGGDEPVAWFPEWLANIVSHPCGFMWAGSHLNHLYLLTLENGNEPSSTNKTAKTMGRWLKQWVERILCCSLQKKQIR